MPKARRRHKLFPQYATKSEVKVIDPKINEETYELLLRGVPQKELLVAITKTNEQLAELKANAVPPKIHKFKLRGPLKNQIPELDAWIAEQFAAGKSATEIIQAAIPLPQDQDRLRVDREREEKAATTAKRLAARAARNDPAHIADQQARWAARQAKWDAAREEKAAIEAKRQAAIAENPTLRWRTPRRKGWKPADDYATGGRRTRKKV